MVSSNRLLGLLLVQLVSGRRVGKSISLHSDTIPQGEERPVQECIYNEPLVLECPADKHVEVVTAFWNRRKRENCRGVENLPDNAGHDCNPNATDRVISFCHGQGGSSCKLAAGTNGCKENPFTFMRVRWLCAEGVTAKVTPQNEEEEIVEEFLAMDEENEEDEKELPTLPIKKEENEEDEKELPTLPIKKEETEAKEWRKNPLIRLKPVSLNWDYCRMLQVGAWGPCEKVQKVGGLTSSPMLDGDNVCRCPFLSPFKNITCDDLFVNQKSVRTVRKQNGPVAAFGYEGCDCHKSLTAKSYWDCDLAVREV